MCGDLDRFPHFLRINYIGRVSNQDFAFYMLL